MHTPFLKRSSYYLRPHPHSLLSVFPSSFATLNPPSQVRWSFVQKEIGIFRTQCQFLSCHSGRAWHWRWHCAVHVHNTPASKLFERGLFTRVGSSEKRSGQKLAWADCSAAPLRFRVLGDVLVVAFRGSIHADGKALCATEWKRSLQSCYPG